MSQLVSNRNPEEQKHQHSFHNDSLKDFDPMTKDYLSQKNNYLFSPDDELDSDGENHNGKQSRKPKLHVTHFDPTTTEKNLRNLFSGYGQVTDLCIKRMENGHRFAFVNFSNIDHAMAAIHGLHLRPPHRIHVQFARMRKKNFKQQTPDNNLSETIEELNVEYYEPELVLSDSRKNFGESMLEMQEPSTPLECWNRYMTELVNNSMPRVEKQSVKQDEPDNESLKVLEYRLKTQTNCAFCDQLSAFRCAENCGEYYCSSHCQSLDWEEHRHKHPANL